MTFPPGARPGVDRALLHEYLEGPGHGGSPATSREAATEDPNRAGKTLASVMIGGGGSYLKLHSFFPLAFYAKPGESWKDYRRSVEFWLGVGGGPIFQSEGGAPEYTLITATPQAPDPSEYFPEAVGLEPA